MSASITRTEIGSLVHKTVFNGTLNIPVTADVSVGDLIVVVGGFDGNSAQIVWCSDTQTNGGSGLVEGDPLSYTFYPKLVDIGVFGVHRMAIWSAVCTTALVANTDNIQIDFSYATGVTAKAFKVYRFVAVDQVKAWVLRGTKGKTKNSADGSPNTGSLTANSRATSTNSFMIGCIAFEGPASANNGLSAGWDDEVEIATSGGAANTNIGILAGWDVVASPGSADFSGTLNPAVKWMSGLQEMLAEPWGMSRVNVTLTASAFRGDASATSSASGAGPQIQTSGTFVSAVSGSIDAVGVRASGVAVGSALSSSAEPRLMTSAVCPATAAASAAPAILMAAACSATSTATSAPHLRVSSSAVVAAFASSVSPAVSGDSSCVAAATGTLGGPVLIASGEAPVSVLAIAATEGVLLTSAVAEATATLSAAPVLSGVLSVTGLVDAQALVSGTPLLSASVSASVSSLLSTAPTLQVPGTASVSGSATTGATLILSPVLSALASGSVAAPVLRTAATAPVVAAGSLVPHLFVSASALASALASATGSVAPSALEAAGTASALATLLVGAQVVGPLPVGRTVVVGGDRTLVIPPRSRVTFGGCT